MAITRTKAATEAHIRLVRGDPDYIEEFNNLPQPVNIRLVEDLYNQYGLELDDFSGLKNGLSRLLNPYTMFSAGYLKHNSESHEFVATFGEDIKKEQFDELWILIQKNNKKLGVSKTKHKPPQEDELLYAIFKARMAGITFRKIFEYYCNDKLLYYEGKSNSQFHSEDELEKYYRKFYKPEL